MNNFFLVQLFDWGRRDQGKWMRRTEASFRWLGLRWVMRRAMNPMCDMTNPEVRQNIWHFATQTLAYGVRGDFAAFGCFDGKTAVIYQKILDESGSSRRLHLYDHFQTRFHLGEADIRKELEKNFLAAGARSPVIHEGDFHVTIPAALPSEIACMDIDCGTGGDPLLHEATVLFLLDHIYPRMTPGSIGILMDYHEPGLTTCRDYNPGVGRACRKFFAAKPEKVHALWADEYPQGYFRKHV